MKAYLKNYRQSPRKVRLVATLIKGKSVPQAGLILHTIAKRAGWPLKKLLDSAVANANHASKRDEANLFVKDVRVDKGFTLERYMPRARGSAFPIRKHSSHISIVLEERTAAVPAPKAGKAKTKKMESSAPGEH